MKNLLLLLSLIIFSGAFLNIFAQSPLYYSQGFEGAFPPTGWAREGSNPWSSDNTIPHSGENDAVHFVNHSSPSNDWLFTPLQSFSSGKTYRISFFIMTDYVESSTDPEKLKITVGTAQNSSSHTTVVHDYTSLDYIEYTLQTFTFNCALTGNYCFGFNSYTGTNGSATYIDDVFIEEVANVNYGNVGYGNLKYSNSSADGDPAGKPVYQWINTTDFSTDLVFTDPDDGYAQLNFPSGKKFRFFDIDYSSVFIGTNGYLTFGAGSANLVPNGPLPQPNDPSQMIAVAFRDLFIHNTDSKVSYKFYTDKVVISCEKMFSIYDLTSYISYQISLMYYETPAVNSEFFICFNDELTNNFSTTNDIMKNAVVGINGPSGTQGHTYRFFGYRNPMFESSPIDGAGGLALAYADVDSPLPVEILSFSSSVSESNVTLSWSTGSETNNSGFDIERQKSDSPDRNWKKVGFVKGTGTTASVSHYSFKDIKLASGKYKYRLKQIDHNGNYNYYALNNEISVGLPAKFTLSQNYPNPFNPETKIDFGLPSESVVSLSVYDLSGRLVKSVINEKLSAGWHSAAVNLSSLSSGIYIYKISALSNGINYSESKRMVYIK